MNAPLSSESIQRPISSQFRMTWLALQVLVVLQGNYCHGFIYNAQPRYPSHASVKYQGLSPHSALHYIDLEYPTGLSIVHTSSIVESAKKYGIQLSTTPSNSFVCILHHDGVAIRPQYQQVHLEENVLSQVHCQEIIAKAEDYGLQNEGWTRNRHTGYPTTDLPVGNTAIKYFLARALNYIMQNVSSDRFQVCKRGLPVSFCLEWHQLLVSSKSTSQ